MIFTTVTFLFFLISVFALYWANRNLTYQNLLLVIVSYIFYGWWDYRFCALMLISSLLDYGVGLALGATQSAKKRRILLLLSIGGNLGILGFFKYYNFFAESFREAASRLGWPVDFVTLQVVLPVGISFYTFQTMSYAIDVYRGELKPTTRWIEFLAYVSFFPQLVAGPIERAPRLLPQFLSPREFCPRKAVDGCRQILWGCCKKMVIADNLAPLVEMAYGNPAGHSGAELALATLFFAFQIYCDFSAYSDIALGTARLFGFELMRNFAYPYFSTSLGEFWRRWHISLTTWFKDYVYFPLGGSRVSGWRKAGNVLATFLLSGLWHGASWHFVMWGAVNGLALLPGMMRSDRTVRNALDVPGWDGPGFRLKPILQILLTFILVCLGWVLFRAQSLADAVLIYRKMWGEVFHPDAIFYMVVYGRQGVLEDGIWIVVLSLLGLEWWFRRHSHPLQVDRLPRAWRWLIYTALIWLIIYAGTHGSSDFIYFQF